MHPFILTDGLGLTFQGDPSSQGDLRLFEGEKVQASGQCIIIKCYVCFETKGKGDVYCCV